MAKCHSIIQFLRSHMAVVQPSVYLDIPFLANLAPIWVIGALICVSWRGSKSKSVIFPGITFNYYTEHKDHAILMFSLIHFCFVHTCLLLLDAGTIWFPEFVKAVIASCQVRGIIIISKDWRLVLCGFETSPLKRWNDPSFYMLTG